MATIAEKYPFTGNTGQCLILNPREKLVYPFNLGEYSEVRFGMFFSYTSGTSNNALFLSSDQLAQSTPLTQMFMGFCNYSTGSAFPGQSGGYDYIGLYGYGAGSNVGINYGTPAMTIAGGASAGSSDNFKLGITNLAGTINVLSGYNNDGITTNMKCPAAATGATSFAGMVGMRLIFSGSKAVQFAIFSNDSTFASDVSTSALRTSIANLGTTRSSYATGFWTTGAIESSSRMSTPNALLLYSPLLNSRLRVHNLIVERYA